MEIPAYPDCRQAGGRQASLSAFARRSFSEVGIRFAGLRRTQSARRYAKVTFGTLYIEKKKALRNKMTMK